MLILKSSEAFNGSVDPMNAVADIYKYRSGRYAAIQNYHPAHFP
jgi:hypothetical protein